VDTPSDTLFEESGGASAESPDAPLAARMRPDTLEAFVGQEKIIAPGTSLRTAIEHDEVPSVIFWGPPGSGKSTLARIIAHRTNKAFENFSAVTSGVADIRKVIARARERRAQGIKTILFVDEIHRFNKAQQDAFLPHVEDGTITLIGATTENPYFEVNAPLLSRSRIYVFERLGDDALNVIIDRALCDPEQGLGAHNVVLDPEARAHIVGSAEGDARFVLNALELAAELAGSESGETRITKEIAREATQRKILGYDKSGDAHYDIISAFIKSMRGSDPDAAVYWLARMIEAGEDPRFIARRMVIHAAEDVGLADPMALVVANAAAHAVEYVGLPEAQIPMAEAAIYIACAPKSNAVVKAIDAAVQDVRESKAPPPPKHLRDSSYRGAKALGHGEGYKYPHNYPGGHVPQHYFPEGMERRTYYEPTEHGREAKIKERLDELRKPPSE
jgi:putative ATPase